MLGSHHRRPAFMIHSSDLLDLLGGQAELREKIRPSIRVIIRRAFTWGRALLGV
jgi:hypothetical protein